MAERGSRKMKGPAPSLFGATVLRIMGHDLIGQQWREEYSRIRKAGGGDYWVGRRLEAFRSRMSPYARGVADHRSLQDATETHNARPMFVCPFAEGTPERAEYERGWNAGYLLPDG
jgi:hypothetical protein